MIIYENEYIQLIQKDDRFFIQSYRKGMFLDSFKEIMEQFPYINVTSFLVVKKAIMDAPQRTALFGMRKEKILVELSGDRLRAYVTINISHEEFEQSNKMELMKDILFALEEKGVVFGLKTNVLARELKPGISLLVAEGIPAINGTDSDVKMYKLKEPKPRVVEDGKVDHYELNLINRVRKGEWLGERTDPTDGSAGKTVLGEEIKPMEGKLYPLLYDRKTVAEEYNDGITVLRAKIDGAVNYKGESVYISNYLEIHGDVDFKTGNVEFDGFLTVKGTVEDNFCVSSQENLEILGEYGVGSAQMIESKNGSIYIRGGIAGKNRAVIKCRQNIYTKFVSDATIICDGSVHIGFYCINSDIIAKEVIVESSKGRIVGGTIIADIKVEAPDFGSVSERRTIIKINGFNRNALKTELDDVSGQISKLKTQLVKVKQLIAVYKTSENLNNEQRKTYERIQNNYSFLRDKILEVENIKKDYTRYLKTPGEGAVIIKNKIFPKVRIEIKELVEEMRTELICEAIYYKDGSIEKI